MKYLIVLLGLSIMISCRQEEEIPSCEYEGYIMTYYEEEGAPLLAGEEVIDACNPISDASITFFEHVTNSGSIGSFVTTDYIKKGTAQSDPSGNFKFDLTCDLTYGHQTSINEYRYSNIGEEYVISPGENYQIFMYNRTKIGFYFITENTVFDQDLLKYEISFENGNTTLPFRDNSNKFLATDNRPLLLDSDNTFDNFKLYTQLLKNVNMKLEYSYNNGPQETVYFYTDEDESIIINL